MAAPTNAAKREESSCQLGAVHTWLNMSEPLLSQPSNRTRTWQVFAAGSAKEAMPWNQPVPYAGELPDAGGMSHSRRRRPVRFGIPPDDLWDYATLPERRAGRPPRHELSN